MHDPIPVKLTTIERQVAAFVGQKLHEASKGLQDNHDLVVTEQEGLDIHIQGAIGECAAAKFLNVFWCGTVNTFKHVLDVGERFEVRSVASLDRRLIVRQDDPDDRYFISVAVHADTCFIKGFLLAKDAKKGKWLKDFNDREPAYFVSNDALKDPKELHKLYSAISK